MAMRILTTRLVQANNSGMPIQTCLKASMSSSTPSTKSPPKSLKPYPKADGKPKRESLRSWLAQTFGGYLDPADPNAPPIPVDEVRFPDHVERATGEEKLLLLAFENGILDPYCQLPIERRGRGTKDNPVVVESFADELMIACVCEDSKSSHRYDTFYKGLPERCKCGHWIKVVDAPRFWEKIPKDDLVEMKFFRDLEEQGKLDKFLETDWQFYSLRLDSLKGQFDLENRMRQFIYSYRTAQQFEVFIP